MFSFHSCSTIRSQESWETVKCDIVCYAWLYIFCITHCIYIRLLFSVQSLERKVRSLREAIVKVTTIKGFDWFRPFFS